MMHQGNAIMDIKGEEKKQVGIDHILDKFNEISIEVGN
jgi:putative ABC transport system ATP-binding protein